MKQITSIAVLPLAIFILSCHDKKEASNQSSVTQVKVTSVKNLQPTVEIKLPGELKPWNKTTVHPKVKGYVSQVLVDRGDFVKRGQVLAVLEAPELQSQLNHFKAKVSSAKANLIEQQSKYELSKLTNKRFRETNQTKGAVSANELDISFAKLLTDSALVQSAIENLKATEAELISHNQFIDYLTIRAAFDGVITERNISPGELVGPEANAQPLFILEDCSRLRLTLAIPEISSKSIQQNSTVTFTVLAEPNQKHSAKFGRTMRALQEKNRNLIVEFDYNNAEQKLMAGMYADVRISLTRQEATSFVPTDALVHSTEGVFVIRAINNAAEWISVEKGNSIDSLIEVFGNLQSSDKIVRHAHEELRNGQAIKIM